MATTTRTIDAPVEAVWATLADPYLYADWVVGAKRIRRVEGSWPDPGAKFHHTVGVWPLRLRDNTTVLECEVGSRLVLEARIRPVGVARVEIDLRGAGATTQVTMTEVPTAPRAARWSLPVIDPLTHRRNLQALRRLGGVVAAESR